MLVHWIWFAHRPGLNDRDKMALLQHFRDPEDIYFADDGAFDAIGLSEDAKTALREKNLTSGEEILAELPLLAGEEVPRISFRQMLGRMLKIACLAG